MFDIINSAGATIATVNQDQLYELRQKGFIKPTDKIIDATTGSRVDNR